MGFTTKRRGGSSDGATTGRSAKSAGSRVRDKYKDKGDGDRSSNRDDAGTGSRSRGGGGRSRSLPRASGGRSSSAESKGSDGPVRFRRKPIDLTLLTRGMSARPIGARVASHIRILSSEDIEKDLRHMEAYATACTTYAQQFFAYTNRELVARGVYGPAPPIPGVAGSGAHYAANGAAYASNQGFDPVTGQYMSSHPSQTQQHAQSPRQFQTRDGRMLPAGATSGAHLQHAPGGGFSMPVKIDPEEEKRLAQLRKKIAVSEAKREVLETEYLSLRAHYVHESQNVKKTRLAVNGQIELLKNLVKRRGEVLALRRARCAIARDILSCLEYRAKCAVSGAETPKDEAVAKSTDGATPEGMEGVEYTEEKKAAPSEDEKAGGDSGKAAGGSEGTKDLIEVWKWVDSQLCDAERACTELETPTDLLLIKPLERAGPSLSSGGGSSGGVSPTKVSSSASTSQSSSRRSRSPTRSKASENDTDGKDNGASKKKSGEKGGKSQSKRSSSDEGASSERAASKKSKEMMALYDDDNVIPWQSQIMPRTPGGVPVYVSYLSSAPDKSGGFGTGGAFGSDSSSLCWLEANVPKLFQPEYSNDREDLFRLREEVQFLAEELEFERDNNKDLQRQVIATRKRSDEMCSMMSILRTETEAVLNRHNMILETPEAQAKAAEVHKTDAEGTGNGLAGVDEEEEGESAIGDEGGAKTVDEISQDADIESMEEGEAQEGDIESAEEGEIQGDDENSGDDEEEGIYDEDEEGEVRVKEVIVRRTDEEDGDGEINQEGLGDDEDGEIPAGSLPEDSVATGNKRVRGIEDTEVESPRNNGGFNSQKRRRRI